jgi:hypothetical protein
MFIAVEGTDASGKSTLVKAVASKLQASQGATVNLFHKGAPKDLSRKGVLSEYVESIQNYNWFSATAVADRWHWGEVTYAPIKRRHTNVDGFGLLGVAGWRWTEMFLRARGITQFWLYQPLEVIHERIETRGDDFVTSDELDHILSLYKFAFRSTLSCVRLSPGRDSFDSVNDLADDVIKDAKKLQLEVQHLERFTWYIGPPQPKALLVGDERQDETDTMLPFKPSGANSADYLLNALPDETWREYGIINSADVYGEDIIRLIEALGNPRIIALGRMAEKRLRQSSLYESSYSVLPHPQHVRRFHYSDQAEYGRAIESFANGKTQEYSSWLLR